LIYSVDGVANIVEIRDLQFGYGERSILSGLNMDFARGKVIAVMGGSGSGKTTILRLIGPAQAAGRQRQGRRRNGARIVDPGPVCLAAQDGHAVPERRLVYRPDRI
jgi:ABC-type nitrate/sulfonate/bicarbonate transport system ATPase subunit